MKQCWQECERPATLNLPSLTLLQTALGSLSAFLSAVDGCVTSFVSQPSSSFELFLTTVVIELEVVYIYIKSLCVHLLVFLSWTHGFLDSLCFWFQFYFMFIECCILCYLCLALLFFRELVPLVFLLCCRSPV